MKAMIAMLIPVLLASPALAGEPGWRTENLQKSFVYSPNVAPPPVFGTVEVGSTYDTLPGVPVGAVTGIVSISPNPNYNGDWNAVTGTGRIEFDFLSQVDADLAFIVGGAFSSITMTVDGNETVWEYPARINPEDAIALAPGDYHFLVLTDGTGQGPGWGYSSISIIPVPEPSAIILAAVSLLVLAAHRNLLKGLRFQGGTDINGVSGDK
jgi:hypothetical protein